MEHTITTGRPNEDEAPSWQALWVHRVMGPALLFLAISFFHADPVHALINDHRSPDGTCQGTPEPPNPPSGCESKICTNDGDWMCCNRCTPSGGYCCEQIETMTSRPKGNFGRIPSGQLQVAPSNPPPTYHLPQAGMNAPIMRRGVEGDQVSQPTSEPTVSPNETVPGGPGGGEVQERAIRQTGGLGEVPGCTCKGGNGTCTSDTSGTSGSCYKAQGNTCTGSCGYGSSSFRGGGMLSPQ